MVDGKWVDWTWKDMEEMKCQCQKNKSRNKYENKVVYSLCFRTIISPIWLRNVRELGWEEIAKSFEGQAKTLWKCSVDQAKIFMNTFWAVPTCTHSVKTKVMPLGFSFFTCNSTHFDWIRWWSRGSVLVCYQCCSARLTPPPTDSAWKRFFSFALPHVSPG